MKMLTFKTRQNKNGFTIIEVVLVLAIAGLIFLMVFLALPALQRSQRDSQRKRHADAIIGALNNLAANNRYRTIHLWSEEWGGNPLRGMINLGYLKEEEVLDPSTGQLYTVGVWGGDLYKKYRNLKVGEYGVDTGYCVGNTPTDSTSKRPGMEASNWVFVIPLESGGWICASNRMF